MPRICATRPAATCGKQSRSRTTTRAKLSEQLNYLDQHQTSIEKARDAYRKQFDIGQRTLLDLLDTENELFQAKRAYVNAEHDLGIAYVRTKAGVGELLASLGLTRLDTGDQPELQKWEAGSEAPEHCPPEAPTPVVSNKAALNSRAAALVPVAEPSTAAPCCGCSGGPGSRCGRGAGGTGLGGCLVIEELRRIQRVLCARVRDRQDVQTSLDCPAKGACHQAG